MIRALPRLVQSLLPSARRRRVPLREELLARVLPTVVAERPDDGTALTRPLAAGLAVGYVLEGEGVPLTELQVRSRGVSPEALHAQALANLPRHAGRIEVHGRWPCFLVSAGGEVEPTLLLHGDFWARVGMEIPLRGGILAVAPCRGMLLFADDAVPEGREFLEAMAVQEDEEEGRRLSPRLLARREGRWVAA